MEFVLDLAVTFWQITVVVGLVLVGLVINHFDKDEEVRVGFKYKEMPTLKPVPIATKGKGFWKGIWLWIMTTRNWEVTKDWSAWNDAATNQTNGWTIEYASNFTFTSVKGVGHMAPQWARKPVLDMVNDFIA